VVNVSSWLCRVVFSPVCSSTVPRFCPGGQNAGHRAVLGLPGCKVPLFATGRRSWVPGTICTRWRTQKKSDIRPAGCRAACRNGRPAALPPFPKRVFCVPCRARPGAFWASWAAPTIAQAVHLPAPWPRLRRCGSGVRPGDDRERLRKAAFHDAAIAENQGRRPDFAPSALARRRPRGPAAAFGPGDCAPSGATRRGRWRAQTAKAACERG